MSNLEELKAKVDGLAQKITDLKKADVVDKNAIGAAVKDLLDAKRSYAQNNNGVGVDGKPWEEPLSKSEKKKRDKVKKAAEQAASGDGNAADDNGKQVSLNKCEQV
jgi:hypothetical protein